MENKHKTISVEQAVQDVQAGRMIIIVDDEDRENEGDLMVAAEKITPEIVNFMTKHGRGLTASSPAGDSRIFLTACGM